MTAAYEVSAARELISAVEKMQQYFRDFRDFDIFEHRSFMAFLRVDSFPLVLFRFAFILLYFILLRDHKSCQH